MNVLDFKKDVGLWHAVQTVRHAHITMSQSRSAFFFFLESQRYPNLRGVNNTLPACCSLPLCQSVMNMMHVISIPYALMKVNPLSWIQKVCQYKGKEMNPRLCSVVVYFLYYDPADVRF